MDKDSRLSEAELKTFQKFMRTELGKKILLNVKEAEQGYLDRAMLCIDKGPAVTHDCVVAAAAIETIYQFLKPPKPKDKGDE